MFTPKYIRFGSELAKGEVVSAAMYNAKLNLLIEASDHNSEYLDGLLNRDQPSARDVVQDLRLDYVEQTIRDGIVGLKGDAFTYADFTPEQLEDLTGPAGTDGEDGIDGTNGIDGIDGADGQGVPTGGTVNQVLKKVDGTDYNTAWEDASVNYTLPTASTTVLGGVKVDGTSITVTDGIISGANTLAKAAGTDINTGTDDDKYVTSKAIEDSNIINSSDGSVQNIRSMTKAEFDASDKLGTIITTDEVSGENANTSGWNTINATLTYSSADAPTFVATTSIDLTPYIGLGNRIRLTQTTDKYFLVTAITSTTITLYGGTDYTLTNATITSPYFSNVYAPLGFPLDPDKWSIITSNILDTTQNTPTSGTWYNLGGSFTVPIGSWLVNYQTACYTAKGSAMFSSAKFTLSTGNNSETYTDFTQTSISSDTDHIRSFLSATNRLNYTSKQVLYLNQQCLYASTSFIKCATYAKTILKAVSAYL